MWSGGGGLSDGRDVVRPKPGAGGVRIGAGGFGGASELWGGRS